MAQKLVQIIHSRTNDGEEVGFFDLFPYLKDPAKVVIDGINPLELATITAKTNFLFIVKGDVDVRHYRPTKDESIPDFSKIAIHGKFVGSRYIKNLPLAVYELDLSKCDRDFVTLDTVFPVIIHVLNCAYCIPNLDILIGKIPESTKELIVESNLIKPSALMQDSDKMRSAKIFAKLYPNLKIYDTSKKHELHAILEDIEKQQTAITQKIPEKKAEAETLKIFDKIDGLHIDIKDIIDLCQKDEAFAEYNLTTEDLKRKIRFVLSTSIDLNKELMVREDGTHANCVHSSTWPIIRQKLLDIIKIQKAGDKVVKTKNTNQPETKTETVVIQNTNNIQQTKEPLDIQKYISDSVIKQVKKSSGIDKFKNILMAINEINLDIVDDYNYQGGVKIIKDGNITVSSTIKKESGCTLVQSCDSNTNNDRKRLVWTFGDGPKGPVIVCQGFFEEHAETIKRYNIYNDCLKASSKRRSFSAKELKKYKNIKDLIVSSENNKSMTAKILLDEITNHK